MRTSEGEVHCAGLVLAGNAWLGRTAPQLARKIIGIGTHIVATEVLGEERASALIRNNAAVYDLNWVVDYFRRSADHRLLFGGRVSYSGVDLADLTQRHPCAHAGGIPAAGRCAHRIYLGRPGGHHDESRPAFRPPGAQRLVPSGLQRTWAWRSRALPGSAWPRPLPSTSERFDVFARIPHRDFPGGPALRRPALALAMLWYRLRDLL